MSKRKTKFEKLLGTLHGLLSTPSLLPDWQQQKVLRLLGDSGRFHPLQTVLLQQAADMVGDSDEILPDLLYNYREWQRAADAMADGRGSPEAEQFWARRVRL